MAPASLAHTQRIRQVGAWPDRPCLAPREDSCSGPCLHHVFPSGRAAILACLKRCGIGPDSRVATPECISSCVADAIRRVARPAPLRVPRVEAAVVYEQWGWPLPVAAQDALRERFTGLPIIVDRVDSADFFSAVRNFGAFEVLSLSKVLGTDAGGVARCTTDGTLLRFEPDVNSRPAPAADHLAHPAVRELFKQSGHVHPSVLHWLRDNCAVTALNAERRARNAAAELILQSELGAAWPGWMKRALACGAGPVWAPVLRGRDPAVHRQAIASLAETWGLHAAVRIFNWTGNPLSPRFEPALALPIHGGVPYPRAVIAALARCIPSS